MWTKGEWKTVLSIDGIYSGTATIVFCNGDFVASTTRQHRSMNFTKEEAEANAQLISAAPNCYKELKQAVRLIEAYGFREPNNATYCLGWLDRAKQAINKAEGK